MQIHSHDVVMILQREKQWHLQQLQRINQVLEASHNKQHPLYPRKKVSWQREIEKIFQTHNNLRPIEVIQ
jgi:hypothetical protein